jgi:hypothetical protein
MCVNTLKPYALAGFEPRSAVPQADEMSTAPVFFVNCGFVDFNQGGQIGLIFDYWSIYFFGHFLKITEEALHNFAAICFHRKSYLLILKKKIVGPNYERFFSQTHLVTLISMNCAGM